MVDAESRVAEGSRRRRRAKSWERFDRETSSKISEHRILTSPAARMKIEYFAIERARKEYGGRTWEEQFALFLLFSFPFFGDERKNLSGIFNNTISEKALRQRKSLNFLPLLVTDSFQRWSLLLSSFRPRSLPHSFPPRSNKLDDPSLFPLATTFPAAELLASFAEQLSEILISLSA